MINQNGKEKVAEEKGKSGIVEKKMGISSY